MGSYLVDLGLYVLHPGYKLLADHAFDAQLKYILLVLFGFESVFRLSKMVGVDSYIVVSIIKCLPGI